MQVNVQQLNGVRFSIRSRSHEIIADQPVEAGGEDRGMTPSELLLASLASCAAYYAAVYLRTRKLADSGVTVNVTAEKLKGPPRLGNFVVKVGCPVPLSADQEQSMLRAVHQCLVHNTLVAAPTIDIQLEVSQAAA
jgi:putative redox protein